MILNGPAGTPCSPLSSLISSEKPQSWLEFIQTSFEHMGNWSKAFLFFSLLNASLSLAFNVYLVTLYPLSRIYLFFMFFILFTFQFSHSLLGIFYHNSYELVASFVGQFLMTVLAALQFYLFRNQFVFTWIVVCVTSAFLLLYGIFAYPLYKEFNWKFFKIFGTDPTLKSMIKHRFRFTVLLRIDLMMSVGLIIVSGYHSVQIDMYFALDMVIFAGSLLFAILGYFGHKMESIPLVCSFWTLSFITEIYVAAVYYAIIREVDFDLIFDDKAEKPIIATLFLAVSALFLIFRVALLVTSILVCRTFGKGSNELLARTEQPVYNKRESVRRSIQPDYPGMTGGQSDEEDELVVEDVLNNTMAIINSFERFEKTEGATPSFSSIDDISTMYGQSI